MIEQRALRSRCRQLGQQGERRREVERALVAQAREAREQAAAQTLLQEVELEEAWGLLSTHAAGKSLRRAARASARRANPQVDCAEVSVVQCFQG